MWISLHLQVNQKSDYEKNDFFSTRNSLRSCTCISLTCPKSSSVVFTVKPVLSSHSKIDKTRILMTNGSLMKVKNEGPKGSILQYF